MSNTLKTLLLGCLFLALPCLASNDKKPRLEEIKWEQLASLPAIGEKENPGVGGAFAGFIGDNLVIAGGSNFPEAMPWEGGKKKWWSTLYSIDPNEKGARWTVIEDALPYPLGYGVAIGLDEGLLCIGGNNAEKCYKEVFLIKLNGGKVTIETEWPSLPVPLSNMTGMLSGNHIYVLGGQEEARGAKATKHFFALDLSNKKEGWKTLPSWPGAARIFAASAAQSDGFDNCIYLFSGRDIDEPAGRLQILNDGWEYNPRLMTWRELDGPFPVAAGSAIPTGANHILLFGGVPVMIPGSEQHPGFDNTIRLYHTITGTLIEKETAPYPVPVTQPIVRKANRFYFPSGELKPGIRTPEVFSGEILSPPKGLGAVNTIVIALYFLSMAWIGFYFSKKQKNTDDYFKGGGRLPWWTVGLSIFGTSLSAITFMAIPAKAYATDWSYMLFNAGIVLVVPVILFLFIPFYRKLNVTTAYEYLEQRFNPLIRVICSIAFILFQIGRMGIVMFLPAIALNVVTGFDIFLCIGLMGVLSLIYTMMGGIEAVVWTDALQVVVLLGGAILAIIISAMNIPGGFSTIMAEAGEVGKFSLGSLDFNLKQSTVWTVLIATVFTNLTTYGTDQTMVQRYMTTETEKQARKSVWTNALLTIPATVIFFFVGTVLYIFYKHNPTDLSMTISDGDAIFPWYIYTQLPAGVVGLLISGIFAAAMSTLSSSMNSAATAYITDIHRKINPGTGLKAAKIATLVLGIIGIAFAYMMATWEIKSMWDEFNKILGLVMGCMGGLFLLGMLTKRANSIGALCGIIGSIIVQFYVIQHQSVHLLLYTTTGFLSCFGIGYIVSLITGGLTKKG